MHAWDIKFAVINVRGTCLIRENHDHLYPEIYPLYDILAIPSVPHRPDKPVIEDPPAKSQSPIPVKPPVDTEALSEAEVGTIGSEFKGHLPTEASS